MPFSGGLSDCMSVRGISPYLQWGGVPPNRPILLFGFLQTFPLKYRKYFGRIFATFRLQEKGVCSRRRSAFSVTGSSPPPPPPATFATPPPPASVELLLLHLLSWSKQVQPTFFSVPQHCWMKEGGCQIKLSHWIANRLCQMDQR